MAYMALFYARIIGSRYELEAESERYRAALVDLEQVKVISERISRNRSQFFSKMSHELRTPLNAIIGYSEILLEDCEDGGEGKQSYVPDLKRINATGRHLLSLVAGVLDVENLETETSKLELSEFTLGGLTDDVVATVSPLISKNGNRLEVLVPTPQDVVHSDEKKLRQMLINLLSNAGKFTRNGSVKFELWVERNGADDRLHAVVTDTGIGIAADVLPKLFDAYMQADETIHSRFGGTGIGLALTRKFAVLLGGEIKATSKLGAGSRFEIDVPAKLHFDNTEPASLAA
jgi:signal transduction histidine kinase